MLEVSALPSHGFPIPLGANDAPVVQSSRGDCRIGISFDAMAKNSKGPVALRIEEAATLRELDLSDLRLTEIPGATWELTHLETLDLGKNRLTTVPADIANLKKLKTLGLNHNKLTQLPPAIGKLSALRHLSLQYNQLKTLPDQFCELKSLNVLWLLDNKLSQLPAGFERLTALEELHLGENNFTEVPAVIFQLPALRALTFYDNKTGIAAADASDPVKALAKLRRHFGGAVRPAKKSTNNSGKATSYAEFMGTGVYKSLRGEIHRGASAKLPLVFGTPSKLRSIVEDYSWLDDVREDTRSKLRPILVEDDFHLVLLAVFDQSNGSHDAYAEEVLLVDVEKQANPVFIWRHDATKLEKLSGSFKDFLASLEPV